MSSTPSLPDPDRRFFRAELRLALVTALLFAAVLGTGCAAPEEPAPSADAEPVTETLDEQAQRLAQELLIIDTHVDVPYRLVEKDADISQRTEDGDFDYPRARAGGLDAPFMSIYIPASHQQTGGAKEVADELIDMVEGFEQRWPEKFAVAASPDEVLEVVEQGRIALPMGMENGAAVEDDLANLQHFFDRGIRYITLTHSENNQICDSSYAQEKTWNGLSDFGRQVVSEMNRLGIMVDVSHVSDQTFEQVMELSVAPVIASHSSLRVFTPGFERNMSEEMVRELASNGGVIQINFGSAFISGESNRASLERWQAIAAYREEQGLERDDPAMKEYSEKLSQEMPTIYADLSDVVDHIDQVVEWVGVDYVGIGSDFDGVGDSLPTGLKDVSAYPNLIAALLERGYSEEDVRKICGGNLMRVWREVEAVAARLSAQAA